MSTNTTDQLFREAMARFTSCVTAITTMENGIPAGLIATSVCSLSKDPPTILVCVNKSASAHDVIQRSEIFAVNLLSADQKDVAQRFSSAKGPDRFDASRWKVAQSGSPILIDSVLSFECKVHAKHNGYSHTIFVGEIIATTLCDDSSKGSLLWHRRGFAAAAAA